MKLIDRSFFMAIRRLLILLLSLLQAQCLLAQTPTVVGGSLDQWRDLKGTSLPPSSSLPRSVQKMDGHTEILDKYLLFPMGGVMMQDARVSVFSDMDNLLSDVLDPFCGKLTYDSHIGVDSTILTFVEQKAGVPVFAVLGGSVIEVGNGVKDGPAEKPVDSEQLGNYVAIDHGNGHVTRYLHLKENSILISVEDVVQAGQQIGLVGSSGVRYWPPHLTFQTLVDGKFVEPFKGDCSNSESLWWDQDSILTKANYNAYPPKVEGDYQKPYIGNFVVTQDGLSDWQGPPFDTSRTGTIVTGWRKFGCWFQFFNFDNAKSYAFIITKPGGEEIFQEATGTLKANLSGWWGLNWDSNNELDFDRAGNWEMELAVFSQEVSSISINLWISDPDNPNSPVPEILLKYPLRVVSNISADNNRPPNPIEVEFMHGAVSTEDVPVCRVKGNEPVLDPDFDFVRFRYVWKVNGEVKRTFISGARSDALPKGVIKYGDLLICEVTPLDTHSNYLSNYRPPPPPFGAPTAVAKTVVFSPFSSWAPPYGISVKDYDSDPDGDGYPNALEYLLDQHPRKGSFLKFFVHDQTKLMVVDIPISSDPRHLFTLQTSTDPSRSGNVGRYVIDPETGYYFSPGQWEIVPPVLPTMPRTWLFGSPFDTQRFFHISAVMPDEPLRTVPKNKIVPIP